MNHLLLRLTSAVLLSAATLSAETLIPAGAKTSWHYWQSTHPPAAAWRDVTFDDTAWPSGPAPLGCDARGLGTRVCATNRSEARPVTTCFRTTFNVTSTNAPHGLFLMVRADDGVEVCLNGTEVARANLPSGEIGHSTRARTFLELFEEEESFRRFRIPAHLLRPGRNVLAASVHQWIAPGDDLVFDLALRAPSEPLRTGEGRVTPAARQVTEAYLKRHRLEPEQRIPDGYIDGGRGMHLDSTGRAWSTREILLVSRPDDPTLRRHLEFARSSEVMSLAPLARATRLARYVEKELSLPDGPESTLSAAMLLTAEYENSPLTFGQMTEVCPAGVCRHRALLFKLMADDAGLKVALVRGLARTGGHDGGHAWNELHLGNDQRLLVDVMNLQRNFRFPSLTEPVARNYLSVSGAPLYPKAGSSGVRAGSRPASAGDESDLLGSWNVVLTKGLHTSDYTFRFARAEGVLTGALISPRSGEYKARTTTFKNGKLTMDVDLESERHMLFEGQLAGDTLSGSVTAKSGENKASFEFNATKEP